MVSQHNTDLALKPQVVKSISKITPQQLSFPPYKVDPLMSTIIQQIAHIKGLTALFAKSSEDAYSILQYGMKNMTYGSSR
jgi:hypothetical protein